MARQSFFNDQGEQQTGAPANAVKATTPTTYGKKPRQSFFATPDTEAQPNRELDQFGLPKAYITQAPAQQPEPEKHTGFFSSVAKAVLPKKLEIYFGLTKPPEPTVSDRIKTGFEQGYAYEDIKRLEQKINPETGKLPTRTAEDVFAETQPTKFVPFLSAIPELVQAFQIYQSAKRVQNNQETMVDIYRLAKFQTEQQRDSSFGSKVASVITNLPSFGGELLLTGGIYTYGKEGTEKAVEKTLKSALGEYVGRIATKSAGNIVGATLQTIPARGLEITTGTIQNMTPEYQFDRNELGQLQAVITGEGDDLWKAAALSLTDQWVEVVSEHSGGIFDEATTPVKNQLVKMGLFKAFMKANPSARASDFMNMVREAGWNGVIAEMGEERIGELLRGGATQVGLSRDGWKFPTKEQLAVELVSFSVPGVMIGAINKSQQPTGVFGGAEPPPPGGGGGAPPGGGTETQQPKTITDAENIIGARDILAVNKGDTKTDPAAATILQNNLNDFLEQVSSPAIQITNADGTKIAGIDVVQYPDGKFATRIEGNITNEGILSKFTDSKLSDTREGAVAQAKEQLLEWAKDAMPNSDPADEKALRAIIKHVTGLNPMLDVPVEVREKQTPATTTETTTETTKVPQTVAEREDLFINQYLNTHAEHSIDGFEYWARSQALGDSKYIADNTPQYQGVDLGNVVAKYKARFSEKTTKPTKKTSTKKQLEQESNARSAEIQRAQAEYDEKYPNFEPKDFDVSKMSDLVTDEGDYIIDREGQVNIVTSGNSDSLGGSYVDKLNIGWIRSKLFNAKGDADGLEPANQIRMATAEELQQVGVDPKLAKPDRFIDEETGKEITQKEQVSQAVKTEPKSIKQVAKETGILEPNVRRILGVGAKDGTFERVDEGVYVLKKDGKELAFIEVGNAVNALPRLVEQGRTFDVIYSDLPYASAGNIGGNRPLGFGTITPEVYANDIVPQYVKLLSSPDASLIHIMTTGKSSLKQATEYNNAILNNPDLKLVAIGSYVKLRRSGEVANMGKYPLPAEAVLVFNKSGAKPADLPASFEIRALDPRYENPKGYYKTEKAVELVNKLLEYTSETGDDILDPFAGSGAMGAEAVKLGRIPYNIEINPDVVEKYTRPRIEAATAQPQAQEITKSSDVKPGDEVKIVDKKTGEVRVGIVFKTRPEGISATLDKPYKFGAISTFENNTITHHRLTDTERTAVEKSIAAHNDAADFTAGRGIYSPFVPNELGYMKRDVIGLDPRYFVAQQSETEFDIIESKRGSTRALVRKQGDIWVLKTEITVTKNLEQFKSTGQEFDGWREAVLAFNDTLSEAQKAKPSRFEKPAKEQPTLKEVYSTDEEPIGENDIPSRRLFAKEVTKYLQAVNDKLGWTVDEDDSTKGGAISLSKVFNHDYVSTIFWKTPEIGIYISINSNEFDDGTHLGTILYRATTPADKFGGMTNNFGDKKWTVDKFVEEINKVVDFGEGTLPKGGGGGNISPNGQPNQQPNQRFGGRTGQAQLSETPLVGAEQPPNAGTPTQERGRQVPRGELGNGRRSAGERPGTRLETNEQIDAFINTYTSVDSNGRVVLDTKKLEADGLDTLVNGIGYADFIKAARNYKPAGGLEKQGALGRGLLDEYFTPEEVVSLVKEATNGFLPELAEGEFYNILEPSVGTGRFLANLYHGWDVDATTDVTAYEINRTSAGIAAGIQTAGKVFHLPFEDIFVDQRGNKKKFKAEYDIVIGNPPYGEHRGTYKGLGEEPRIAKYEEYFIKRSLDITKEGGVVAMVVPSGILRGEETYAKREIAKLGMLVNAYRLPNKVFGTTDIGTDILVFKRTKTLGIADSNDRLETQKRIKDMSGDAFFEKNPNNIIGEQTERKSRFGGMEKFVTGDLTDVADRLVTPQEEKGLAETIEKNDPDETPADKEETLNVLEVSVGTGEISNKKAYIKNWNKKVNEPEAPPTITGSAETDKMSLDILQGQLEDMESNLHKPEEDDQSGMAQYNREVDAIKRTKEQINILKGKPKPRFAKPAEAKPVVITEANKRITLQPIKKTAGKLSLASLSSLKTKDAQDIAVRKNTEATGEIQADTLKTLSDADLVRVANFSDGLWYNDFNYYSDNIYERLDQLEKDKSQMSDAQYKKQKKGLEAVLPPYQPIDKIFISPNTPFVENTQIYNKETKENIPLKNAFLKFMETLPQSAFGQTSRWEIREYVQQQPVRGDDKVRNQLIRVRRREVGDKMFKTFLQDGLDKDQQKQVADNYNRLFNGYYRPDYKEVPLSSTVYDTFKGKKLDIKAVQQQGIGFLTNKGMGLLAHDVGVGKTMQAIITTGEMLQRGWAKKPLIVTPPGNVYFQWIKEIQELIPDIKINTLANLGGDFKGDLATLEIEPGTISIMTYEGFKRLGFADETYNDLTKDIQDVIDNPNEKTTKRGAELEKSKAEEVIGQAKKGTKAEKFFEDLGFDMLVQDEVHNSNHIVKGAKLKEKGKATEFRGLTVNPSALGVKTWLATQYIQKHNGNRNVMLLSATPFTNNPMEYYSILSLMARKRLSDMGLSNVNEFMNTFMDLTFDFEVTADGKYQERNNIRGFKNYQQFQKLITEFIDFRDGEEAGVMRPNRVSNQITLHATQQQLDLMDEAQELFSPKFAKNAGKLAGIGEMRKITYSPYSSRYYKGALPTYKEFVENSPKVRATMEAIRQNKKDEPAANQVIYSPIGVEYFPLIKEYLVKELGFKDSEIGVITGAVKGKDRVPIQERFNKGIIKIIIGSDAIQEGVNLQEKTTDLYILALPWNFTELKQVVGRVWRQGNEWKNIRVHNVFIENSVDVFQSQKLETKQKRYENSLKFKGDYLDVGDIDFDELKLDLIKDPVMKVEVENAIQTKRLKNELEEAKADYAYYARKAVKLTEAEDDINTIKERIANYTEWGKDDPPYLERIPAEEAQLLKKEKELEKIRAEYKEKGVLDFEELAKRQTLIELKEKQLKEAEASFEQKKLDAKNIRVETAVIPNNYSTIRTNLAEQNPTFFEKVEVAEETQPAKPRRRAASGVASMGGGAIGTFEEVTGADRTPEEAFKLFEQVKGLVAKYAKSIGEDYTPPRASGVFYTDTTNIRIRGMNDLAVAAHDVTHFLDFAYNISDQLQGIERYASNGNPIYDRSTRTYRKEMTDLYQEYYPGAKPEHSLNKRMIEGFATLLQKYVEQPTAISAQYPSLVKEFLLPEGKFYKPVIGDIIRDLRAIVAKFQGLPALDKIGARVVNDEVNVNSDSFLSMGEKLKTETADEVYPIEVLAKRAGVHFTKADPSLWVRQYSNSTALILNNLNGKRGYYGWRNGELVKLQDFNWKDVIKELQDAKITEQFGYWLVARREHFAFKELQLLANQLKTARANLQNTTDPLRKNLLQVQVAELQKQHDQLKSVLDNDGFTEKEVSDAYLQNRDRFAPFAERFDVLVREDLNFLHDTGLVTDEEFDRLSSEEGYASFKRFFYDELVGTDTTTGNARFGTTKVSSLLTRTGSKKPIINPLFNSLKNHGEITRKGLKQIVYNRIGNVAEKSPELGLFQKLKLQVVPDGTGRFIYPQEKDPQIIMARIDGKRVPFLVNGTIKRTLDEVLTYQNINVFENLLLASSRFFTKGTTGLFPGFAITNYAVDQISGAAQSREKYIPLFDPLSRIAKILNPETPQHQFMMEYMVMGGERQTLVGWQDMSPNELFNTIGKERTGLLKVADALNSGMDILAIPAKWSEIMTRATEYIKARENGKTQIVALEEAGRITAPFHHIGRLGGGRAGKNIVKSIPFFNPGIQVLAQAAETMETAEGRRRFAFVALAVTAAQIAGLGLIMAAGSDDQKRLFAELNPDELNKYVWFPNPNGRDLIKIRVPDIMAVLGTLINMLWANKSLDADYTAGDFINAGTAWLPAQLNPTQPIKMFMAWIPQLIKPGVLTIAGVRDFPKILPLESQTLTNRAPEFRFNEQTSPVAKYLGKVFNMSPIKIDYLLTGYAGRATGFLTGKPGIYNPLTSLNRQYYFTSGRKVQHFYDLKKQNDEDYEAFNNKRRTFRLGEPTKILTLRARLEVVDDLLGLYRDEQNPDKARDLRDKILKKIDDLGE